jgi:hypothetical protein
VEELWRGFGEARPRRVPVVWNFSRRFYLLTPWLNGMEPAGGLPYEPRRGRTYSFREYFEDPAVQWEVQLALQRWIRENVPQDGPWGLPEEWDGVSPDFQNVYEAAWLGCPIEYRDGEVPDTRPLLRERKGRLASMTIPDPIRGGIMGRGLEFRDYFDQRRRQEQFCGRPVGAPSLCGGGTDGPFTVACNLRGTSELCVDMYEDPRFVRELLDFVTEAIIVRVRAVGEANGTSYPQQRWGFADDSIQLLSVAQYREVVLPYHRRLLAEFSRGGPNSIHLCGSVQRLLPALQQELNIQDFDLGFPVDLGQVRRELGPRATLHGNLHPELLRGGPPSAIGEETARIMQSGVKEGRRFVFSEGNNVAPATPVEHFAAAYEAAKVHGVHSG